MSQQKERILYCEKTVEKLMLLKIKGGKNDAVEFVNKTKEMLEDQKM